MINNLEEQLYKMSLPNVESEKHRQELRRSLLTSSFWDKQSFSSNRKPSLLSNIRVFLKGGEKNMNIKRFALSGLVVAILVAGVFASTNLYTGSSTVYAKEIAQKSVQTVNSLSDEQKQTLGVPTDAQSLLTEAQNAKDLSVLTYDQVKDILPNTLEPNTVPFPKEVGQSLEVEVVGDPQEALTKLKDAKFLQFTNSQGAKVLIAVDVSNVPFFTNIAFGK